VCELRVDNRTADERIGEHIPKNGGSSHDLGWFNENVVGGFTQTGAEWTGTDELVRSLYDTMKPQVEVVL